MTPAIVSAATRACASPAAACAWLLRFFRLGLRLRTFLPFTFTLRFGFGLGLTLPATGWAGWAGAGAGPGPGPDDGLGPGPRPSSPCSSGAGWCLGRSCSIGWWPPVPTSNWTIMSWSSWTRLWQCIMYRPTCGPKRMSTRTVSPSPT